MRRAIIWTNADQIHWRVYAALGGDELIAVLHVLTWFFNSLARLRYDCTFHYIYIYMYDI